MKGTKGGLPRTLTVLFVVLGFAFVLTGCGTTALVHKGGDSKELLDRYQTLTIKSSAAQGIVMTEAAQERIEELVKANLEGKYCPKRFKNISTKEAGEEDLLLLINYTDYNEGSKFGRFMLAGIGGMKIHADVLVRNTKSDENLCQAEVGKTFHWGGIYGAMTDITEIEKWFAEEIAKTFGGILGIPQPE